MTRPNVNRRFALLVSLTLLAWLGLFVHNTADLPTLTLLSPENSVPALVSAILVIAWWLLPWKRGAAIALLGWGLLHLIGGGILSVLPLAIWPYEPAQTPRTLCHAPPLRVGPAALDLAARKLDPVAANGYELIPTSV